MKTITIRRVGEELTVTLPGEMLAELGLGEGDEIVAKSGGKVIELSAPEPDVERALEIARRGAEKYRNALAELAK